jgi:hypothetical protein
VNEGLSERRGTIAEYNVDKPYRERSSLVNMRLSAYGGDQTKWWSHISAEDNNKIVVQHFWDEIVARGNLHMADGFSTALAKLVSAISRSRVVLPS